MRRSLLPIVVIVGSMYLAADAFAQNPSGSWTLAPPPKQEVLIGVSLWALRDFEPGRSVGARYIWNFAPEFGVEAGLDVGSAASEPFGIALAQVRLAIPDPRPALKFVSFGLAAAVADPNHPTAPRRAGWVLGGGIHGPLPKRMGLRLEAQLMMFGKSEGALRVMFGLSKGRG
jgi:hypothetical protein